MCEMLWTDPQDAEGRGPSKRGVGLGFGPDVTKRWTDLNEVTAVIRAHEVRQGGYSVEHDGRLITVFSAPNYVSRSGFARIQSCRPARLPSWILLRLPTDSLSPLPVQVDQVGNLAAFARIDETGEIKYTTFEAQPVRSACTPPLLCLYGPLELTAFLVTAAPDSHSPYDVRWRHGHDGHVRQKRGLATVQPRLCVSSRLDTSPILFYPLTLLYGCMDRRNSQPLPPQTKHHGKSYSRNSHSISVRTWVRRRVLSMSDPARVHKSRASEGLTYSRLALQGVVSPGKLRPRIAPQRPAAFPMRECRRQQTLQLAHSQTHPLLYTARRLLSNSHALAVLLGPSAPDTIGHSPPLNVQTEAISLSGLAKLSVPSPLASPLALSVSRSLGL